jgi:hypothetical protein
MKKRPAKKAGASASARPRAKKSAKPAEPIELPEAPKRGRGRPTTYDPSYCDRVIELGEQGKSKAQIAKAFGCSRKALYAWMKAHEEFAEAMEEAQFAALAWWEDLGMAGLKMGNKFNSSLFAYQMKNRFRTEYADKVDVAHSGKVDNTTPEERELTDLDLARRVAFMLSQASETIKRRREQGLPVPAWQHGDVDVN